MIFSKPIDKLNIDDVRTFCREGVKEGFTIDYKVDIPKNLAKTVCAFANTYGGIVLIGIDEDRTTGKPVTDDQGNPMIHGIPMEEGLYDRITQIILSNIHPPLFPEIGVVPFENDAKAVIVIRIPESEHTPYAVDQNRSIYVRTDSMNAPEERATVEQLEWLQGRRRKATELKQKLYKTAEERIKNLYGTPHLWTDRSVPVEPVSGRLTLSAVPLFPNKPIASVADIRRLCVDTTLEVRCKDYLNFPLIPINAPIKTIQQGTVYYHPSQANDTQKSLGFIYHEFNCYGMLFYQEPLLYFTRNDKYVIRCNNIIQRLEQFLIYIENFYKSLGMAGLLEIKISINDIFGTTMVKHSSDWGDPTWISHDFEFCRKVSLTRDELSEQRMEILYTIIRSVCDTFNFPVSDQQIKGELSHVQN